MKIYELRSVSDIDSVFDEPFRKQPEEFTELILGRSRLFTTLERAKAAAEDECAELHVEAMDQDEIDSEEIADNVIEDLEWEQEGTVWSAECEAIYTQWRITEHEIQDPTA